MLKEKEPYITDKHILISTITGYWIAKIESAVGSKQAIIRAMFNTAIAVGKSMSCICSNDSAENSVDIAQQIFNKMRRFLITPYSQM